MDGYLNCRHFSIVSINQTHEHNRNSVRPLLEQSYSYPVSGDHWNLKLSVKNNGLGPGIVKEFVIFWRDNKDSEYIELSHWNDLSEKVGVNRDKPGYFYWIPGNVLRANKKYEIYNVYLEPDVVKKIIDEKLMQVKFTYESLYDEIFTSNLFVNNH